MKDSHKKMNGSSRKILLTCVIILLSLLLFHAPLLQAGELENEVAEELLRIKTFASYVKRDGNTLYLRLKSGSYVTLANLPGCAGWGSCREYEFLDYFMDVGFYHVNVYSGEISEYLMISDNDGENYWVYDYARISPDRKRFVSVSEGGDFAAGGIFIGFFEQGKIMRELGYKPIEYGQYSFVAWKDDFTILLSKHSRSDAMFCPGSLDMTVSVTLKLDKGEWVFREELSNDTVKCGADLKN